MGTVANQLRNLASAIGVNQVSHSPALAIGGTDGQGRDLEVAEIAVPLTFRGLTTEDLPACAWWGSPLFLTGVAEVMTGDRDVEYLAACPPSGLPIAAGGIDFGKLPGAGVLWQLGVHGALQSCGIGTLLIGAAEDQDPRARPGPGRAKCRGVQPARPRAVRPPGVRRLRTRTRLLGTAGTGRDRSAWTQTVCTLMRKELR